MRKPETFDNLQHTLRLTAQTYRRALWADQDVCVEVWLEKGALAGVIYLVTERWDVPLMVTRGYPSLSFLYEAAQDIRALNKLVHLYYLGDYDPSGVDIPRQVAADLPRLAPGAQIHFSRLAVMRDQVRRWHLPTRRTKQSDSRAKRFLGDSVEVDAIPAQRLRQLVEKAVTRHVDRHQLAVEDGCQN